MFVGVLKSNMYMKQHGACQYEKHVHMLHVLACTSCFMDGHGHMLQAVVCVRKVVTHSLSRILLMYVTYRHV